MWACNCLRTKHFHVLPSARPHAYSLKSRYGKVRNAVLRVVETGPHTFLFEPVSVGHTQAPSLSLYRPYFHNLSEEYARETYEFSELQRCLTSINYNENYSQID